MLSVGFSRKHFGEGVDPIPTRLLETRIRLFNLKIQAILPQAFGSKWVSGKNRWKNTRGPYLTFQDVRGKPLPTTLTGWAFAKGSLPPKEGSQPNPGPPQHNAKLKVQSHSKHNRPGGGTTNRGSSHRKREDFMRRVKVERISWKSHGNPSLSWIMTKRMCICIYMALVSGRVLALMPSIVPKVQQSHQHLPKSSLGFGLPTLRPQSPKPNGPRKSKFSMEGTSNKKSINNKQYPPNV